MKLFLCIAALGAVLADPTKSIVENAIATPSLSTLVKVLTLPGYKPVLDALSGPGPFTVFAPNNDAFAAAGVNPDQIALVTQVLMYHVVSGAIKSTDLAPLQFPRTLMTSREFVNIRGKGQALGISLTRRGVSISFGVPGVGNLTANVVVADVISTNGVVHIIDRVMFFPESLTVTAKRAGLTEYLRALEKVEGVEAADGFAGFTMFAPTNEAMLAIRWESLDIETLKAALLYHVIIDSFPAKYDGVFYSTVLSEGDTLQTLLFPTTVAIKLGGGLGSAFMVNDANVVVANILLRNGVLHVVDKALHPTPDVLAL